MNKIYLIMTGEYSDRHCVGYCTTEEEAKKYCAIKNSAHMDDYYHNEYDIEEQECLDGVMDGVPDIGVSFRIIFDGTNIRFVDDPIISARHKTSVFGKNGNSLEVRIWQKEADENKARKIAQDAVCKWYAEEMELNKSKLERLEKYLTGE